MKLNEELFSDLTEEEVINGISTIINDAISNTLDSISNFLSIITTLKAYNKEEFVPIIQDIIDNQQENIGKLEKLMSTVKPNSEDNIETGKDVAEDIINNVE